MVDAAGEALPREAAPHRLRMGVQLVARGRVRRAASHPEHVEVEQRRLARGDEHGAAAERRHLGPPVRRLPVEVHEGGARGGTGGRALADVNDAVGDVGREVALEHLHDHDADRGVGGVRDEADVDAGGGGDVAAAQLPDDLAVVRRKPRDGADGAVVVGDPDHEPAPCRVGERRDDLGDLLLHGGGEAALELQGVALLEVAQLVEVGVGHLGKRLGPTLVVLEGVEHAGPPFRRLALVYTRDAVRRRGLRGAVRHRSAPRPRQGAAPPPGSGARGPGGGRPSRAFCRCGAAHAGHPPRPRPDARGPPAARSCAPVRLPPWQEGRGHPRKTHEHMFATPCATCGFLWQLFCYSKMSTPSRLFLPNGKRLLN